MNISPVAIGLIIWIIGTILVYIDLKPTHIREVLLSPLITLIMPFWLVYIILKLLFTFLFSISKPGKQHIEQPEETMLKREVGVKYLMAIGLIIIATLITYLNS